MDDKNVNLNGNNNEDVIDDILNSVNTPSDDTVDDSVTVPEEAVDDEYYGDEEFDDEEYSEEEYDDEEYSDEEEQPSNIRKAPKPLYNQDDDGKKKKKKKKKKTGTKLAFALIRIFFIVGASVVLSYLIITLGKEFIGIDRSEDVYMFQVDKGMSTSQLADKLKDEGMITSTYLFRVISKLKEDDGEFQAGTHELVPAQGYEAMIDSMKDKPIEDKYESVSITFTEGTTLYDTAQILLENKVIEDADRFIELMNSRQYLNPDYKMAKLLANEDDSKKFYAMEGYFFPDTYTFYIEMGGDVACQAVCEKVYENFEDKLSPYYDKIEKSNYSLDEIITLASIVQKEAPSADSMANVASVFINRLTQPEKIGRTQAYLESDPTTSYANDVVAENIKKSAESDMIIASYDTYQASGLTPGAICNPGIEAIDAVVNAPTTDYYYFYANIDTKQTYFAKTLEEQNANEEMVQQQYDDAAAASEDAAE